MTERLRSRNSLNRQVFWKTGLRYGNNQREITSQRDLCVCVCVSVREREKVFVHKTVTKSWLNSERNRGWKIKMCASVCMYVNVCAFRSVNKERGTQGCWIKFRTPSYFWISDTPHIIFQHKCVPNIAWDMLILKTIYSYPNFKFNCVLCCCFLPSLTTLGANQN